MNFETLLGPLFDLWGYIKKVKFDVTGYLFLENILETLHSFFSVFLIILPLKHTLSFKTKLKPLTINCYVLNLIELGRALQMEKMEMWKSNTDYDTNKDIQRTNIDQKRTFEPWITLENKDKYSNHSKSLFPFLDFLTV